MAPTRADPTLCPANWWGETVWVRSLGIGDRAGRHRPCRPGPVPPAPDWALHREPLPGTAAKTAFLALGVGAVLWLKEAAAQGTSRILVKMDHAVSIATHRCGPN